MLAGRPHRRRVVLAAAVVLCACAAPDRSACEARPAEVAEGSCSFGPGPALPEPVALQASAVAGDTLVGIVETNFGRPNPVLTLHPGASATSGGWHVTAPLPASYCCNAVAVVNGFVYSVGGRKYPGPVTTADVLVARLGADGEIGAWTSTTPLPSSRYMPALATDGRHLYVIAGSLDTPPQDTARGASNPVLLGTPDAEGSIREWVPLPDLPGGRALPAAVALNGFLYVVGGMQSPDPKGAEVRGDMVEYARIFSNGRLGAWHPGPPLPVALAGVGLAAASGTLYVVGGMKMDGLTPVAPVGRVWSSPVSSDGSPCGWVAIGDIPSPGAVMMAHAVGGEILAFSGELEEFGPPTMPVWSAPVLAHGLVACAGP